VRLEKWGDSVAERGTGMRVIAAFFRPCAPEALTARVSVFLPLLQEVRPICKTRNQFRDKLALHQKSGQKSDAQVKRDFLVSFYGFFEAK